MSFLKDRQVRRYWIFCGIFLLLLFFFGAVGVLIQVKASQRMMLSHDNAVATSLLEQGIPQTVVVTALSGTKESGRAGELLSAAGRTEQTAAAYFPQLLRLEREMAGAFLAAALLLAAILLTGTFLFFRKRERLYREAAEVISGFAKGDDSRHLPRSSEGTIYQLFSETDRLATMLQAENETQRKTKEFLRDTISDISHQLKTPLAALALYQEIIEGEPDNPAVVGEFSAKMRTSLERLEELTASLLKITRLDAGSIAFEKKPYQVSEVLNRAIGELAARAKSEGKELLPEGSLEETILCDMEWTGEAIGNLVKNALDHTDAGGKIRIICDRSPCAVRITVKDDGQGIAPEDIHHIFKRFYRSRKSAGRPGIGLGLSLAKSIIDGQGGTLSVQSAAGEGAAFTVSFLTEL